jgi:hypothetical protein
MRASFGGEGSSSSYTFVTTCLHQQKALLRLMILLRPRKYNRNPVPCVYSKPSNEICLVYFVMLQNIVLQRSAYLIWSQVRPFGTGAVSCFSIDLGTSAQWLCWRE